MTTRPRFGPIVTLTRVSRCWENSSSSSSRPGARSLRTGRRCHQADSVPDPDGAVARELGRAGGRPPRPRGPTVPRPPLGGRAAPGRPGPACRAGPGRGRPTAAPSATSFWTAGGSWNRRSVLVTAARLLPTRWRDLVVGEVELLDQLLVGRRLLEWVEVLAMEVLHQGLLEEVVSSTSRTRAGIVWSPARLAARHRRSPAMSSYSSSPAGRTRTGWSTPTSRIDAVSDASASSSKCAPGLVGVGLDAADRHLRQRGARLAAAPRSG